MIFDQSILAAGPRGQFVHRLLDDPGNGQVVRIGSLARLEEDVGVLRCAAHDWRIGSQAACPEGQDILVADQCADVVHSYDGDLVDLVRRPEAVEEVQERDSRAQRGGVSDECKIVRFLHRASREHRPARRPRVHDVAVVPEDGESVRRDRARSDVDHGRRELTRDLEHVGESSGAGLARP